MFLRARKPEEKEVRRQALLNTAREMLGRISVADLSLSSLARGSCISKANIYRYFESREEILLQLWIAEVQRLADTLEGSLGNARDERAIAQVITRAFVERPLLCELAAIVASVLERNLSEQAVLTAKLTLLGLTQRFASMLHARLPKISIEDSAWAASSIATYVAGLWPAANPGPAAKTVLARPELAGLGAVFGRDLQRYVEVLLRGLATSRT